MRVNRSAALTDQKAEEKAKHDTLCRRVLSQEWPGLVQKQCGNRGRGIFAMTHMKPGDSVCNYAARLYLGAAAVENAKSREDFEYILHGKHH